MIINHSQMETNRSNSHNQMYSGNAPLLDRRQMLLKEFEHFDANRNTENFFSKFRIFKISKIHR